MVEFIVICLFVSIVSYLGFLLHALTIGGAVIAFFIGIWIGFSFQFSGLFMLGVFFLTSSFLSLIKKQSNEIVQKGERRDGIQALANGGPACIFSLLALIFPESKEQFLHAYIASLAIANGDTWASELGTYSTKNPIDVFSLKRVPKGTSGAISLIGTISGIIGSILIAGCGYLLKLISLSTLWMITIIGCLGLFFDTFLGATFQAKYCCQKCRIQTERKTHCETETIHIKGFKWMNNDVVNFLSILLFSLLVFL